MALKVTLSGEFEAFVNRMIESGRYSVAGQVVDDALYFLEERERAYEAKLTALRAEIQKGIDSGPAVEVDPKTWVEDIKRRGRERLAADRRDTDDNAKKAS